MALSKNWLAETLKTTQVKRKTLISGSTGLMSVVHRNPNISRSQSAPDTMRRRRDCIKPHYHSVIRDQLTQGIVEVVEEPMRYKGRRIHYLPHHGVVQQLHDKQTTKLWVVYDASVKTSVPSLNDCLCMHCVQFYFTYYSDSDFTKSP